MYLPIADAEELCLMTDGEDWDVLVCWDTLSVVVLLDELEEPDLEDPEFPVLLRVDTVILLVPVFPSLIVIFPLIILFWR